MLKDTSVERPGCVATSRSDDARDSVDSSRTPVLLDDNQCLLDCDARLLDAGSHFVKTVANRGLLVLSGGYLQPALAEYRSLWLDAINAVRQSGQGRYFALLSHPQLESIGMAPYRGSSLVSVRLPRPRLSSPQSVRGYARLIRLTPRETHVLDLTIQGNNPAAVAASLQTRESTVRTQIKSILAKSNHHSVRDLLVTIACLPSIDPVSAGSGLEPPPEPRMSRIKTEDCGVGAD